LERETLGVSGDQGGESIRLWVASHGNGWEAWVAEHEDGTFTAWACPVGANAIALSIEDSFENACAAAAFDLARFSQHDQCGPTCSGWSEREPPTHSHQ
jgi:hypothetical protein